LLECVQISGKMHLNQKNILVNFVGKEPTFQKSYDAI